MTLTSKDWVKIIAVIIVTVLTLGLVGFALEYYAAQQTAKELEDLFATPKPSTINSGSTDTPTWTASKELGPESKAYSEETGEITYYNATIVLTYSGPPMINLAIYYVYNTDPDNWDSERIYYGSHRIVEEGFTLTYNGNEFLIDGEVTNSTFQIKWTLASNGNQGEVFVEV
jgi:hypothetical protein